MDEGLVRCCLLLGVLADAVPAPPVGDRKGGGAGGGGTPVDVGAGELAGEGGAGEQGRVAVVVGVAGPEKERARCIAGGASLEAPAHAGGLQQGEELGLVGRGGDGTTDPQT